MENQSDSGNWSVLSTVPEDTVAAGKIKDILENGQEHELGAANDFRGRVATRVLHLESTILKIRSDVEGDEKSLNEYIHTRHNEEHKLGIHHPSKVWFVAKQGDEMVVGNICDELKPLNMVYGEDLPLDPELELGLLTEIYGLSIRIISEYSLYLDIALSNFGIATDMSSDTVFYLDDDFYPAHESDFSILSESLGTLIRTHQYIDLKTWDKLGEQIREYSDKYFGMSVVGKFSYAIGEPPLVRPEAVECRNALLKGFIRKKIPKGHIAMVKDSPVLNAEKVGRKDMGPPKIALLSDIHANAAALETVIRELENHNITRIIITGDIVGYGPDPGACIDILSSLDNLEVVQGNHDFGAGSCSAEEIIDQFNGIPRDVLLWTQNVLSDTQKTWLHTLPKEIRNEQYWVIHGSPKDPRKMYGYVYVMTYEDNLDTLEKEKMHRCFHGHTHVQGIYVRKGKLDSHIQEEKVTLESGDFALINAGSVGQPRGGKPGAEFALLSEDLNEVEFIRIDYEKDQLFRRMREAGLHEGLQKRISNGR